MTAEFFQRQMERLSNVFGGAYKTERTQLIWKEMAALPEDAFERVVNKLIGECRQAPMIQDFREAASVEREKIWQRRKDIPLMEQIRDFDKCPSCGGQGVVLARRKDDQTPWAFKCGCPSARNDGRNYPLWHPSHDYAVVK